MGTQGLTHMLNQTAAIQSIPAGNDPAARSTVIAEIACSRAWPLDARALERAGLASTARGFEAYVTANAGIQQRMRFVWGGVDYRIVDVAPWSADVYRLVLELESTL